MFDELIKEVENYYTRRDLVWPTAKDAGIFLICEISEILDSLMRKELKWVRNNSRSVDLAEEIGDSMFMLLVFSKVVGIDPFEAMLEKMETKLKQLDKL